MVLINYIIFIDFNDQVSVRRWASLFCVTCIDIFMRMKCVCVCGCVTVSRSRALAAIDSLVRPSTYGNSRTCKDLSRSCIRRITTTKKQ